MDDSDADDTDLESSQLEPKVWVEPPDVCEHCGGPVTEDAQRTPDSVLCGFCCRKANAGR